MEKSSNRRFGVRTVAAIVAGLMVGGMCTAMTASAADDSAAGYSATAPVNLTRPATVPSMDGWTDGTGAWTLGEGTRVVSGDALAARAQSLASELTKFTDVDIKAATGSATGKDISLTLDASKKAELGMRDSSCPSARRALRSSARPTSVCSTVPVPSRRCFARAS